MSIANNPFRSHFPVLSETVYGKRLAYLDSAATTLKPQVVIDSINHYYAHGTANVHRGIYYLSDQATNKFELTREKMTKFINAKSYKEVIFTTGTTGSVNLVAQSYVKNFLKEGDEILLSQMEHHSNIVPWQLVAEEKKLKIKVIPINEKGELLVEEYKNLFTEKTKFVSVTYVSNALGTINPVKELIQIAHSHGAKVFIDAAQAMTHLKVDVQALDCDFLGFSGHKMFGPTGIGVLYGKENLLEMMPPYQGGGEMIDQVSFEKTTFNDLPHKFEAGTPPIASVIALGEAISFIENVTHAKIHEIETELLTYATAELSKIEGLRLIGTAAQKTSVCSFYMRDIHPHDVAAFTDKEGIAIRTGHHCAQPLMKFFGVPATARASLAFYNDKQDIDQLIASLQKVIKIFG